MNINEANDIHRGNFHLNKWFLDYVGEDGEAMIFYAAKLTWFGLSASYTSWLRYNPASGVELKTRFRKVHMPVLNNRMIEWGDEKFGVSGVWESIEEMVQARLSESEEGFLDWRCFQPASKVRIKLNNSVLEGRGYAEQLILTAPPWKIPMDELRWGRFGSDNFNVVWIEIREKVKRQWLWLNGKQTEECIIGDDHLSLPANGLVLKLDRGTVLESEKKIGSVVAKLIRYIPGFNKVVPVNFLMADETKWLSNGELLSEGKLLARGVAIHEMVNFNA